MLAYYEKLAGLLGSAFLLDTWPKLLKHSPFAGHQVKPQEEKEFYLDLLRVQKSRLQEIEPLRFLTLWKKLLGSLTNASEKALLQGYENKILQAAAPLIRLQQRLRASPSVTIDNLSAEAEKFQAEVSASFRRMGELLHRALLPLTEHLEDEGACTPEFLQLYKSLDAFKDCWEPCVIDPAKPLFSYLNWQRWLRVDDEARKSKVKAQLQTSQPDEIDQEQTSEVKPSESIEVTPAPKPSALSLLPTQSLDETWNKFESFCKRLPFISCGFNDPSEQATRLNLVQDEAAKHLLGTLPALQELKAAVGRYGEKPFFINALYLKLAAAMEQASQLSLAATHCPPVRNDKGHLRMMQQGAESYWKNHSPLSLSGQLESQNGKARLEPAQRAWLKKLERVIAITSRRPASGFDEMADELDAALYAPPATEEKKMAKCQEAADKIKEGLKICMTLLSPVIADESEIASDESISENIFAKPVHAPRDPAQPQRVLKNLEERLGRLQTLRLTRENRRVIPVHAEESTLPNRQGTIETCLMNLQAHLGLCRSILEAGSDPSICLLLTEQSLLMEATMLEEALLILCSYLPLSSGGSHSLWKETNGKPLRYCHALSFYTGLLIDAGIKIGADKTKVWAQDLESYLRFSYRYYRNDSSAAGILRAKMQSLSRLRQQGPDAQKDARLGSISLDGHISKLLQTEVRGNLLDLLEHVNDLLGVYEELLAKG